MYADPPKDGTLVVLGLGPIGDMACRIARHIGVEQVIGVDLVPERLGRAQAFGVDVVDVSEHGRDLAAIVRERTQGRGPDAVIDAVGMEAHGSPAIALAQKLTSLLPGAVAGPLMQKASVDRLAALHAAIDMVRRGGTISLIGVYGGAADPMPMMTLFDKQIQIRMGQANVKRWVDEILPLLTDEDPLGVDGFASHRLPLDEAPQAYDKFQRKVDGYVKVQLKP
jgi:threonine dehydrogenase-like Zn-dependent dehydrogenase